MEIKELFDESIGKMNKTIIIFEDSIKGFRTGAANPGLLEGVTVDVHGAHLKLPHISTISINDSRTMSISVWDSANVGAVKIALERTGLGQVASESRVIRLVLSPLTEESRKKYVKLLMTEKSNQIIAIRHIRQTFMDKMRNMEKDKLISEDEKFSYKDKIQVATDKAVASVEEISSSKEKEILG